MEPLPARLLEGEVEPREGSDKKTGKTSMVGGK